MTRLVNSSIASLNNDVHWVSPVKGEIKINCDASVSVNDYVVAGIARDWRGKLVFAFALEVMVLKTRPDRCLVQSDSLKKPEFKKK